MFAEFGPAPLCLELDFDSFDGPPHWIARLRHRSGWLMVAEATIQSEHDILTDKLVVACDEQEEPIPSFKAMNLIHCDWINPTFCDEIPPDILDELLCEEEGALLARWHREKNSALAEAFERQQIRVAELEERVNSAIARNEAQIGELRQRRRHPSATPDMRRAMAEIIRELDEENDELLAEMAETRAIIRQRSSEFEETLWSREDLLIEVNPLHLIRWQGLRNSRYAPPAYAKPRTVQYVPACGPTGGSTPALKKSSDEVVAKLTAALAKKALEQGDDPKEIAISADPPKQKRKPLSKEEKLKAQLFPVSTNGTDLRL